VDELVGATEASLESVLGKVRAKAVLERSVLTPACGLALRSVLDAERLVEELRRAQAELRGPLGTNGVRGAARPR
jgi:hypothetical protein